MIIKGTKITLCLYDMQFHYIILLPFILLCYVELMFYVLCV